MSGDDATPVAATSEDVRTMLDAVRSDGVDIAAFKARYQAARRATIDRRWPPTVWPLLEEIFYVMEEHSLDPALRARQGGLDDAGLRDAVASQVPALEEEYARMRADEDGRARPATRGTAAGRAASEELLGGVRAFLGGTLGADEFAVAFRARRAEAGEELPARTRAAVDVIDRALAAVVRVGRPRLWELDERGLRARVADVEPRLAAAVENS